MVHRDGRVAESIAQCVEHPAWFLAGRVEAVELVVVRKKRATVAYELLSDDHRIGVGFALCILGQADDVVEVLDCSPQLVGVGVGVALAVPLAACAWAGRGGPARASAGV